MIAAGRGLRGIDGCWRDQSLFLLEKGQCGCVRAKLAGSEAGARLDKALTTYKQNWLEVNSRRSSSSLGRWAGRRKGHASWLHLAVVAS